MIKHLVTLDFETYWDKDVTLSKLTPMQYLDHPEFEVISVALKVDDKPTKVFFGDDVGKAMRAIPWEKCLMVGHNCLTPDHEVLTPDGWVRFDQLDGSEKIAQWDANTGAAEFVSYKPVKRHHAGKMLKYDSNFHKGVYTPDHRIYWQPSGGGSEWRVSTAAELATMSPNRPYVPSAADRLIGFHTTDLTTDEARLLEAFRADGTWTAGGAMQFGFKKMRKVHRLTALLDSMGLRYSYAARAGVHCFRVSRNQTAVHRIKALIGSKKKLSQSILTIPPESQRAILEETKYWDGSDWGGKTSHTFSMCDLETAEWFQTLACLNGHGFKHAVSDMTSKWAKPGRQVAAGTMRKRGRVKTLYRPEEIDYDGFVYCVAVPSQAFLVRREGAVWITGNCSEFDALIAAWVYDVRPAAWGCTLAMARPHYAKAVGGSLKALAEQFGLQAKGSLEATNTKGKHLEDFSPEEVEAMREYNKLDVEITYELFKRLRPMTSSREMKLIDITTRMFVEPQFHLNEAALQIAKESEQKRRLQSLQDLAARLGEPDIPSVKKMLGSAAKFKDLLWAQGVDCPMKISPTTGKSIPALAKTDRGMADLLEHPNELIRHAAEVRLEVKSTLLESRIAWFLDTVRADGRMPVPLRYCGADQTWRWSGTAGGNCFGGDTEVLTRQGWRRFDEWRGEPIMQWWPDGRLTFEETPGYLAKPHEGDVVEINSRFVSGVFTPDHRFVSCPPTKTGIKERTADWIATHSGLDNIPLGGVWEGAPNSLYSPDETRLMVAIAADGYVDSRGMINFGFRKARKAQRLRDLLVRCGVSFFEREKTPQQGHSGSQLTTTFHFRDSRFSKGLGRWLLQLSQEALLAASEEIIHWDGWSHHNGGSPNFCTANREDALWAATLWHLTGHASRVRVYPPPKGSSANCQDRWVLHRRASKHTSITTATDVTVREFVGTVYCASVESSYILVRHNDGVFVCGQCQNLPRIDPDNPKPTDILRNSLIAPPGYKIVVSDLSGIELRVNHFLWKVPESMRLYQENAQADLYRAYAARVYNCKPEEVTKEQRRYAKLCMLSLGYQTGWQKFQNTARNSGLLMSEQEAKEAVYGWRDHFSEIASGWKILQDAIPDIARGESYTLDSWGLFQTEKHGIRFLPYDTLIHYPGLKLEDDGGWTYQKTPRKRAHLFGGKMCEQLVSHLSRQVMVDAILSIAKTDLGRQYPLAHTVHDEIIYVVKEEDAEEMFKLVNTTLSTSPTWWPELVVFSEGDVADSYGAAK
ncbi:MAG: DNA polymerase [Lamprobacter sp.]|uniref:DNA polymerase n=1 Tax=Lamprobacter sp. TaxID=3100796 RepID=UPI002B25C498|nr:DNA polymerase [Lamprobacter sp.]MEA3639945.1 DNA polymerase [Lamprobacter sp.]